MNNTAPENQPANQPSKSGAKRTIRHKAKKNSPLAGNVKREFASIKKTHPSKFDKANPKRVDKRMILESFASAADLTLPENIWDQVNVLWQHAFNENPYKAVYLAVYKRVFRPYWDKHPVAYAGPNPTFTRWGMEGDPIKVQFVKDVVDIMRDKGFLVRLDAAAGGAVWWLVGAANFAIREYRCRGEYRDAEGERQSYTYDPNEFAMAGLSFDAAAESERNAGWGLATKPACQSDFAAAPAISAAETARRFEVIEETHAQNIAILNLCLEKGYRHCTPACRRERGPIFAGLLAWLGVQPAEVGCPDLAKCRPATREQWRRRLDTLTGLFQTLVPRPATAQA